MGPLPGAIDDVADIQDRPGRRRLTRPPIRDRFPKVFPLPPEGRLSMVKLNVTKEQYVSFLIHGYKKYKESKLKCLTGPAFNTYNIGIGMNPIFQERGKS